MSAPNPTAPSRRGERPVGASARATSPASTRSTAQASRTKGATSTPAEKTRLFTDAELDEARHNLELAFALTGHTINGKPACPECGSTKAFSVKPARGTYYCFKGDAKGTAIDLLVNYGNHSFIDAVNTLLGRPTGKPAPKPKAKVVIPDEPDFVAVIDTEVYDALLNAGSVADAQAYYARWHIDPDVVLENRLVVVRDPRRTMNDLAEQFGLERLIACGLVKDRSVEKDRNGRPKTPWPMVNADYNVIEPHLRPDGMPVAMQFRASLTHEPKVAAHIAYKKAKAAAEERGEPFKGREVPYVPKFMSLLGAGEGLVGCGLPHVSKLAPGSEVYIVEGLKDMLAARTMGVAAYAIPGVSKMPPPKVCRILARHTVVLSLDGDDAGANGAAALKAHFDAHGVSWRLRRKPLPDGMDVTDVLVARTAATGCACSTCQTWRSTH